MSAKYDYDELEQEFIQGPLDQSIRAFAAAKGIEAWSTVNAQANKREWRRKRDEWHARVSQQALVKSADRMAEKILQVKEDAVDLIHAAIFKMAEDMRDRTVKDYDMVAHQEYERVIPGITVTPADVSKLIDRLLLLSGQPTQIGEQRNASINLNLGDRGTPPPDVLAAIAELTRDAVGTAEVRASLPGGQGARKN